MLPKYYRFWAVNNTGQVMTFNDAARLALRLLPWKFNSRGDLVYGTVITDDFGFGAGETIADAASVESSVVDNTGNLFLGLHGYFEETHDLDAADGRIDLYVEFSDDNSNWPSDEDDFDDELDGIHVVSLMVDNSAVDKSRGTNFTL